MFPFIKENILILINKVRKIMSEQSTVLREKKYGPRYTLHDPPRCFCHCVKGHNNSLRTAVEKTLLCIRYLFSVDNLVGLLPSEKHTDVNGTETKEMEKREVLLSPSCPIRNTLQPQRQVRHGPNQALPDQTSLPTCLR